MRILSFIAGAAGRYCGSCLQNNVRADALYGLASDPAAAVELGRKGVAGVRATTVLLVSAKALKVHQAVVAAAPSSPS